MTVDDRVGNARAPHLVLRWGGTSVLRAPLSTTGELGRENGASTTRRKVPAAVPGATTGTPRVASQTKQNKTKHHNSPKTAHAGGFLVQGHPAAARGLFPIQEPPKTRALASGDLRSYAPGRLGPMRKTRKQDSKKIKKKWPQGLCRHADSASLGAALKLVQWAMGVPKTGSKRHEN